MGSSRGGGGMDGRDQLEALVDLESLDFTIIERVKIQASTAYLAVSVQDSSRSASTHEGIR